MSGSDYRLLKQLWSPTKSPAFKHLILNPGLLFRKAGLSPEAWQESLLQIGARYILMLCSRQSGKSTASAALALQTALIDPGALTLLLSPTQRQSSELFRKVMTMYRALQGGKSRLRSPGPVPFRAALEAEQDALLARGGKAVRETQLTLELQNGSRIVALPGSPATVAGYSGVALLIVDEAALCPDDVYNVVRPMLGRSQGRLLCVSTPRGKRGFFHREWTEGADWHRINVTANDCAWLSREFLEAERRSIGEHWFRQEYLCSFEANVGALFREEDIQAMLCEREPFGATPDAAASDREPLGGG